MTNIIIGKLFLIADVALMLCCLIIWHYNKEKQQEKQQVKFIEKQLEIETLQKLKFQNELNASLAIAVSYGDTEEVKRLLNTGANPYSLGSSFIIHAAKSGYYDTLKLILDSQKSKIDKCIQED